MGLQFHNETDNNDNKKKGIIISTMLHMLLLLIILSPFFSFTSNKNDILISSITIDLGHEEAENTEIRPSRKTIDANTNPAKSVKSKKNTPNNNSVPKTNKVEPTTRNHEITSSTIKNKASVVASKNNTKTARDAKAEKDKEEAKVKEAIKAQKAAEEAAEKAAEEAAKKAAIAAKAKAKSKFSNLLNNDNATTPPSKGNSHGKPNAKALENITASTGSGKTGSGLGNRQLLFQPTINDDSQKTGKVNIKICVDKSGKVTKAKYTQKGSTTTDAYLIQLAEKNARKYQFNKGTIEEQCGIIIIDFRLK